MGTCSWLLGRASLITPSGGGPHDGDTAMPTSPSATADAPKGPASPETIRVGWQAAESELDLNRRFTIF
jgi:hypothetical protein